jgi:hypothetical protein
MSMSSVDCERLRRHIRAILIRLGENHRTLSRPADPRKPSDRDNSPKGDVEDKAALLVNDLELAVI